jgi:hypothetical protein
VNNNRLNRSVLLINSLFASDLSNPQAKHKMFGLEKNDFSKPNYHRKRFTTEQNLFLSQMISTKYSQNDELKKWKSIRDEFNLKFPDSERTGKDLKNHYNNVLNSTLKRGKFFQEEKIKVKQFLQEYGCQYRKIAQIMRRLENSVKNYYNRHLKKTLSQNEIEKIHSSNRKQHFNNDRFDFITSENISFLDPSSNVSLIHDSDFSC